MHQGCPEQGLHQPRDHVLGNTSHTATQPSLAQPDQCCRAAFTKLINSKHLGPQQPRAPAHHAVAHLCPSTPTLHTLWGHPAPYSLTLQGYPWSLYPHTAHTAQPSLAPPPLTLRGHPWPLHPYTAGPSLIPTPSHCGAIPAPYIPTWNTHAAADRGASVTFPQLMTSRNPLGGSP